MNLSEQIKEKRKALGLTQAQLAEATGVTVVSIGKYENGKLPTVRKLLALSKVLGPFTVGG